jgi:hypothetical protein
LGQIAAVCSGINSGDNDRFVRLAHEARRIRAVAEAATGDCAQIPWVPYVKGGRGRAWIEPLVNIVFWPDAGLPIRVFAEFGSGANLRNINRFFELGVAFTPTGSRFCARIHRFRSICDMKGASVFGKDLNAALCLLNSARAIEVATSLNPTVSFQVGDVCRIPWMPPADSSAISEIVESAFTGHEAARESSVEFKRPGLSPWRYAQDWAQRAVDRPDGAPLPPYDPENDPPQPAAFVSFAVGVALGRFGTNGEGILDRSPATALPHGILFLGEEGRDSLEHPACAPLLESWKEHGAAVG